jgi:hypothetical protein
LNRRVYGHSKSITQILPRLAAGLPRTPEN